MLRSLKDLERYTVMASDGEVGKVLNFLLDDDHWGIRYLVVETGSFFEGHQVLIPPAAFGQTDWATQRFHLALTRDQIQLSPDASTDLPVSGQRERDQVHYFGYPGFWGNSGIWNLAGNPGPLLAAGPLLEPGAASDDNHLRSSKVLFGYHIQAMDEPVGHVEDFIIDDSGWNVRYLVVDTSNWWLGKQVLVSPWWASRVSWEERKVFLELSGQEIQASPEWNPEAGVNREYEARLYDYYGRPVYWSGNVPEAELPTQPMQIP
jgi:hypothetical protein